MSFVTAALIVGGTSLASGYLASKGAERGAQTQADAMRQSAQLQREMFDIQNAQQKPYREAGYSALSDITGMKPYLTQQFGPEQFAQGIDPGYAFRLAQGQRALEAQRNLGGGLIGGNALQAMQDYTQGQASQEYGNAFNRFQTQRANIYNTLAGIAGLGQTSLGQTMNASTTAAGNIGSNIAGAGSAIGAGQVASANAIGGGIQGAGNAYMLSNILAQRNPLASGSNFTNAYNTMTPGTNYLQNY